MITEEQLRGLEAGARLYFVDDDGGMIINKAEYLQQDYLVYTELARAYPLTPAEAYTDAITRKREEAKQAMERVGVISDELKALEGKLKEVLA